MQLYIVHILQHEGHSPTGVVVTARVMAMQLCHSWIWLTCTYATVIVIDTVTVTYATVWYVKTGSLQ